MPPPGPFRPDDATYSVGMLLRVVVVLVVIGVTVYALVDCWGSDGPSVRLLPRALWFIVVLVPVVGPVLWLVAGRPRELPEAPVARPLAPTTTPSSCAGSTSSAVAASRRRSAAAGATPGRQRARGRGPVPGLARLTRSGARHDPGLLEGRGSCRPRGGQTPEYEWKPTKKMLTTRKLNSSAAVAGDGEPGGARGRPSRGSPGRAGSRRRRPR